MIRLAVTVVNATAWVLDRVLTRLVQPPADLMHTARRAREVSRG